MVKNHFQVCAKICDGVPVAIINTYYLEMCFYCFSSLFKTSAITSQSPFTLSTEQLEASFDGSTGLLQSLRAHGSSNREVQAKLDFTVYSSHSSGAYLFLPSGGAKVSLTVNMYSGPNTLARAQ